MAQYKEGTLVENKGAPQWGPGKIVHIAGDHLHILFRDIEGNVAKKLRADTPALRLAAAQSDPILDNLPPLVEKGGSWIVPGRNLTLESARQKFLHWFPAGFTDPKYRLGERDYKMEAHRAFEALLGLDEAKDLLLRDEIKVLTAKASSVLSTVNLLDPRFEGPPFRDAMQDENAARSYFKALLELLETTPVNGRLFSRYADAVCSLPAARGRVATWPVATVLPFLARPDVHMFLKPEVTKHAASSLGFDLKYEPTPNWKTYEKLLRMGATYLDLLRPLGATDFVDVQSFIFVSCGGYDSEKPTSKSAPEIVLKVGAEGGSLTLLRARSAGEEYHFWMDCDETTLADFLVDGDQIGADDLRSRSGVVSSLEEAFRLLDRYPYWPSLEPLEVHPDLRLEIFREVNRKGGIAEEKRWSARLRCR
jgi:hypothetical protein